MNNIVPARPIMAFMGFSNIDGLQFEKVKIVKSSFQKDKLLIISGYIKNNSDKVRIVPDLRVEFLNDNGAVLDKFIHDLPMKTIAPGETTKISNRIIDYPIEADKIALDIGNYLEFLLR